MFRDYIFTESFFTGWVIVSFIWAVFGFVAVGLYPLYEGLPVFKLVINGLRGLKSETKESSTATASVDQSSGDSTPIKGGDQFRV